MSRMLLRGVPILMVAVASLLVAPLAVAKDKRPPNLEHEAITQTYRGEPIEVKVTITDPSGVFDPTLYYRVRGDKDYLRSTLVKTGDGREFVASIPAAAVTGDVEYFLEAYDELGNGPARVGGPNRPQRIRAQERPVAGDDPPPPPVVEPDPPPPEINPWFNPAVTDPKPAPKPKKPPKVKEGEDDQFWLWATIGGAGGAVLLTGAVVGVVWLIADRTNSRSNFAYTVKAPAPIVFELEAR